MNGKNEYYAIHVWIIRKYGSANRCEKCGVRKNIYDWALKKGLEYERNVDNFIQLCRKCHRGYDDVVSGKTVRVGKYDMGGDFIKAYKSIKDTSLDVGVIRSSISNVLIGRSASAAGFIWKYIGDRQADEQWIDDKKKITHNGMTKTRNGWSLFLGGGQDLVSRRIEKLGWSIEKAVSTPAKKQKNDRKS
jgi:hypothetical protein